MNNEQSINSYRPVLSVPACVKDFEKIIFDCLFKYLDTNSLLNNNQSGFRPSDSYVHQLLSIIYNIYNVFDANPSSEARGAFLDLWKAFDRVWHKDSTYKLKCLGICEKFFRLIHSFLIDRRQKLVLHGQSSI